MRHLSLSSNRVANIVAVIGVLGLIGMGGFITFANIDLSRKLEASQANAQALYEQLLDEGIAPEAEDPEEVADTPVQAPVPGPRGSAGADGEDGDDGTDGRTPTTTEVFAVVSAYCAVNDQCRGIPGLNGLNGSNGSDGATIVGPQGPAGADGAAGATGADGQPPLSWSYTDVLGMEHTCTRTEPFDPANPTYSCN